MLDTDVHCGETTDNSITQITDHARSYHLQASAQTPVSAAVAMFAAKIKPVEQAIFELEDLEHQREKWEGTELAASHKRLYSILLKCYEFYLGMKSPEKDTDARKALRDGLDSFIKARDYHFKANTHDMNRVVKAVFGSVDRRRVSAYSLALRAALVEGPVNSKNHRTPLAADQLVEWIEDKGGVEEVRAPKKTQANAVSVTDQTAKVKSFVTQKKLMKVSVDAAVMPFDMDAVDKQLVVIATYLPTGEFELHGVVKNDSVVKAALAAYYTENKADVDAAQATAQQQSKEAQKHSAIEQAAAQA